MTETSPSTDEVLNIISGVVLPLASLERTMVMPFVKARHENVAEHSYMLGIVACALAERLDNSLDLGLIAQFALAHDIVEVHAGDVSVWASAEELDNKKRLEDQSLQLIAREQQAFPWIARTIEEYERLDRPEACYVYALDKMLAHMLIIIGDYHPVHPTKEDYMGTEHTAREKIGRYPLLLPYFEELCQIFRERQHFFQQ
jgi:5'-deoxynucleotidase YfbR-like HD superfamily hydrolase